MKRTMTCRFLKSVLCLSTASLATLAMAQYSTGFENPPYASGALGGQDSWSVTAGRTNASVRTATEIATELTAAGLTAGTTVHSGDQALLLSGGDGSSTITRDVNSLSGASVVMLDFWARPLALRSDVTGIGNVFMTMQDSSGNRATGFRFGYYDDGGGVAAPHLDYASASSGTQGVWQDTGIAWDPDTWYHIAMNVDYIAQSYDFLVDGVQINTTPIPFYNDNVVNSFSRIHLFRGSAQTGMILDDLSVNAVPEPTSLAFLLVAGGALLFRRRI